MTRLTKIAAILVLLMGAGSAWADLTDGLVAHWKLDETTGLIAEDSAGDNHGIIYGAMPTTGTINGALEFDGVNDYVALSQNAVTTTEFTIAAWANHYGQGGGDDKVNKIFLQRDDYVGSNHCATSLTTMNLYGDAAAAIRSSIGSGQILTSPRKPYGEWHHYAMTVDSHNFIFYIDGVEVDSASNNQSGNYTTSIDHVYIGRYMYEGGLKGSFNGAIDEVIIYDRALSAAEIEELFLGEELELVGLEITGPSEVAENHQTQYHAIAIYDNNSTSDVTTSAVWSVEPNTLAEIDENGLLTTPPIYYLTEDITIYAQYTQGSNTVDAEKPVSIFPICPTGSALEFDGVDDYVALSENAVTTTEFTVAAWANQYGLAGGVVDHDNQIFTQRDDSVGAGHSCIGLTTMAGTGYAEASLRSSTSSTMVLKAERRPYGQWHHYAMTVDSDDFIFYIDGLEVDSKTNNQSGDYVTSIDHVYIGRLMYSGGLRGSFNGAIDEVIIYNRSLSAQEIQMIMHTKAEAGEPNLVGYWDFDEGEGQVAHDTSGNGNDGQLGSSPDIDDSDPNWVDSDAPIGICTPEGLVERNVNDALEIKQNILQQIEEALLMEDASVNILDGLFREAQYGHLDKRDIIKAKQEIHSAIQGEEQAIDSLEKSAGDLEDSLEALSGDDASPETPPGRQSKTLTKPAPTEVIRKPSRK